MNIFEIPTHASKVAEATRNTTKFIETAKLLEETPVEEEEKMLENETTMKPKPKKTPLQPNIKAKKDDTGLYANPFKHTFYFMCKLSKLTFGSPLVHSCF